VLLDAGSLSEVDGFELAQAGRLEFTADGSLLAVSSPEIATQLYAAASWQLQRSLPVHSHDLDFDSKGRLVTADTDGFIRLWDVISGSELQAIPVDRKGIGSQVGRVSFLDDEHHLLTIDNGVLLIMTIDTDELLKLARSRVTRTLSEAECTKYLHEACPP
jgi:WD40 repeat protein